MASILDRYGIKEVADVTFYTINDDGKPGNPVLYLDSLKVSTLEQTAETVYAQGGKGNPRLIGWDFGKEITISLEDALFSPKSMAVMFGNGKVETNDDKTVIKKTISYKGNKPTEWIDANGKKRTIPAEAVETKVDEVNFLTFDVPVGLYPLCLCRQRHRMSFHGYDAGRDRHGLLSVAADTLYPCGRADLSVGIRCALYRPVRPHRPVPQFTEKRGTRP